MKRYVRTTSDENDAAGSSWYSTGVTVDGKLYTADEVASDVAYLSHWDMGPLKPGYGRDGSLTFEKDAEQYVKHISEWQAAVYVKKAELRSRYTRKDAIERKLAQWKADNEFRYSKVRGM